MIFFLLLLILHILKHLSPDVIFRPFELLRLHVSELVLIFLEIALKFLEIHRLFSLSNIHYLSLYLRQPLSKRIQLLDRKSVVHESAALVGLLAQLYLLLQIGDTVDYHQFALITFLVGLHL